MECCTCSRCTTTPVGACDRYDRLPAACRCHRPCLMNALSPRAHVALSWRPEPVVTPQMYQRCSFSQDAFQPFGEREAPQIDAA